jgi:hypothetical protein
MALPRPASPRSLGSLRLSPNSLCLNRALAPPRYAAGARRSCPGNRVSDHLPSDACPAGFTARPILRSIFETLCRRFARSSAQIRSRIIALTASASSPRHRPGGRRPLRLISFGRAKHSPSLVTRIRRALRRARWGFAQTVGAPTGVAPRSVRSTSCTTSPSWIASRGQGFAMGGAVAEPYF